MFDLYAIGNKVPFGIIVVDITGEIHYQNLNCLNILDTDQSGKKFIQEILPGNIIIKVIKDGQFVISTHNETVLLNISIITGKLGMILFFPNDIYSELISKSSKVIDLKQELEAIMNLNGELVTITDADGIVLRVSNACEQILGVKEHDFIGKSAPLMEKNGVIKPSSTKYVIENKRKITMNQVTKSGRRLIVHAHPIFKEDGSLHKVINISKDVTEIENLQKQLEETKSVLDYYQQELRILKKKDQEMIYKSKAMERVYELACRVADVDATIFIHGETGVGKEVLARTVHNLSIRKNAPFVKINCAAIPDSIIESELFGYAKGTFTGANKDGKKGLALAAHKGTLFLDEIGELPLQVQAKLLQLLQEKRFTPLGETKLVEVDVRFIAATNRNLEEMVRDGTFREDLYYRLFVVPITIPPLSQRKEDIPFLVSHFLESYSQKYKQYKTIDKEVIEFFMDYEWKGNVRELQNTVERLVLTVPAQHIKLYHLPEKFFLPPSRQAIEVGENVDFKKEVEQFEKQLIIRALETSSTMREASKKLGVDASTISRKVQKYKINVAKLQFLM
ncbi:sigma 54-interacting transcriptional regulator [Bacillus sp. DTU_2020_1000418_1_SI_GHA_SEK_038]|uniref:sigma-54 interaction domain-containing protein n=1 Tax=Bacillus sp. DTU_2020_1000418_1_SI_GHA_SEK_038 TaxID=3077585 RepID=UPI0028EF2F29|nr:sigma 54-interacting transcriptional regulator [Bacillus sp. DTU_2020_1000418_1_SI_GHA_SEK_038]WNS76225.1 sigma 54-interacting transcriptional regulator [Bacillus sp. DTU_2020_1000418_1_SI_GHA_SEK_038]